MGGGEIDIKPGFSDSESFAGSGEIESLTLDSARHSPITASSPTAMNLDNNSENEDCPCIYPLTDARAITLSPLAHT
jgi:hypothetical protein